ncbi:MAG: glycosyltransferase family 4 protein, partial [Chloroflexi bacterium]|nr:glycosyltransferase family 4 protein [Chloroflexota bacterium]
LPADNVDFSPNGQGVVMKKIVFVCESRDPCSWYRAQVPAAELRRRGHDASVVLKRDWSACNQADVIVFERTSGLAAFEDLLQYKTAGKFVVYDLDDNIWNINPVNPASRYWANETPQGAVSISMRIADVVTVTTANLAGVVSKFNPNVAVIPNCLPDDKWNIERPDRETPVIGWAGSATHWGDLKLTSGVINQVLDEFPAVGLAVAGMPSYPFADSGRVEILKPVKLEDYAALIARFDIGLAPLTDDSFNACKSDLKFLEYAALGLSVIASKVPAYSSSVISGTNGFLARNPKDWLKLLRRLLNDGCLRREIGEAARAFAETRFISKNIESWEDALGLTTTVV